MSSDVFHRPLEDLHTLCESDVLAATVHQLAAADTLERVAVVVTAAIRTLLSADRSTFALREGDECICAEGDATTPLWKGHCVPPPDCVSWASDWASDWAMLHGEVIVVRDVSVDERIPHDIDLRTRVTSLAVAPVGVAKPVATLGAYWRDEHQPSPSQIRLLEILANSTAVALENLELREAVRRRSEERDHLAARADELQSAIQTIVHDLRSPLGAMLGNAELIEDSLCAGTDEAMTREQTQQFAHTIAESGRRMADQIDRTLSLYRMNRRPLQPGGLNLTAMALEVISSLRDTARDRDLDVTIEDGLSAEADPVLTHLVLENLLGNAMKYTARKPVARIFLGRAPSCSAPPPDEDATPVPMSTFVVRDNGAGFPSDQVQRLFRPMSRLHRDEDFPGTGLGLASVARVVERHGGQIWAEGEPSCGASFYFTLPRAAS